MKNFIASQSHIHIIARGLLVRKDMVVLCRVKGSQSFFLPGGHVENGESARTALARELSEEIGVGDYRIFDFLGVCENIFLLKEDILQHEINLVFNVEVPDNFSVHSQEDHIEFVSVRKQELRGCKILPVSMKDGILEWLENGKQFFKDIK